jgi:hypothetical protein
MLGLGLGLNKGNSNKGSIVKDGLVLWLDGRDFKNSPPTSSWKDKSGLGNNGVASGFGYIANDDGKIHYEVEGNTLKNELTYNKDTWVEWTKSGGAIVGDATGIEITSNGFWGTSALPTNLKPSTKYGYLINIANNNMPSNSAYIDPYNNPQTNGSLYLNGIGNIKFIDTTKASFTNNRLYVVTLNTNPNGVKIKLKDFRVYELPPGSEIEADFTNLTADQLSAKYQWHSAIKSVGEDFGGVGVHKLEALSRGKNLAPPFSNTVTRNKDTVQETFTSDGKVIVNGTSISSGGRLIFSDVSPIIKLKANKTYKLSMNLISGTYTGNSPTIVLSNIVDLSAVGVGVTVATPTTITVSTDTNVCLGVNTLSGDIYNNYTFNYQLEEGSTVTTYVPYTEDKINISLQSPLRKLPNGVMDKYSEGVVNRNIAKFIITDVSVSSMVTTYGNVDYASVDLPNGFKQFIDSIDNQLIIQGRTEIPSSLLATNSDLLTYYTNLNVLWIAVPKGTTLAQSKVLLAGIVVFYQLATPTTESISVPQINGFVNGSLLVDGGAIPIKTNILNYAPSGSNLTGGVVFDGVDDKITIPNSSTFIKMYRNGIEITPTGIVTTAGTCKNIVAYNRNLTANEIAKNLRALR